MPKILEILTLLSLILLGCGNTQDAEFYGDLLTTPEGLTLTQEEHEVGWGQSQCFICHHPDNIHQEDNLADVDLDVTQIQELVKRDGLSSCKTCHGTNGVTE